VGVSDIETVEGALPSPVKPELPQEMKDQLPKPEKSRSEEIEFNMWWKIADEWVRDVTLWEYLGQNFKDSEKFRRNLTRSVMKKMILVLPIDSEATTQDET